MILEKIVTEENGEIIATVKEMPLGQVRQLFFMFMESDNEYDLKSLLTTQFEKLSSFFKSCIVMNDGSSYDDLTYHQIEKVWADFTELNPFFLEIQKMLTVVNSLSPEQLSKLIKTQLS